MGPVGKEGVSVLRPKLHVRAKPPRVSSPVCISREIYRA